jgi:gamma-glutamylcyclotransferase (GGCT)/AIG2-like uncharacterized protein YtfP
MGYPAFLDDAESPTGVVVGELLWLNDLAATLAMLDAFEGADFVRVIRKASIASSRESDKAEHVEVWAWVYVLADSAVVEFGEHLTDGDWVRYLKAQAD